MLLNIFKSMLLLPAVTVKKLSRIKLQLVTRYQRPQQTISELPFASASKQIYVLNHSYENEFCLQVHFHANQLIFIRNILQEALLSNKCAKKTTRAVSLRGSLTLLRFLPKKMLMFFFCLPLKIAVY